MSIAGAPWMAVWCLDPGRRIYDSVFVSWRVLLQTRCAEARCVEGGSLSPDGFGGWQGPGSTGWRTGE